MMKLLPYELGKIWKKRSYQALTCVVLAFNLLLLWYLNIPDGWQPPLSAYRAVSTDLAGMSEEEKFAFIAEKKESVEDRAGSLTYTDSKERELALFRELYEEIQTVAGYGEYLQKVQQNRSTLGTISIFTERTTDQFSGRNIEKSAKDHARLADNNIRWFPSKGIRMADGGIVTDLFLLLSVFLFVGCLVTEEKEKGLFYITRSTKHGTSASIGAKLAALLVHSVTITVLVIGSNLIYIGFTVGLGDLTASIQSVPAFLESSLSINLLEYLLLGALSKSLVLFGFGSALSAIAIAGNKSFLPQLVGLGWIGLNGFAYALIPAASVFALLKYLSLFGLLDSGQLYGGYLNFNIAGMPIARLSLSWVLIVLSAALGTAVCVLLFCRGKSLEIRKGRLTSPIPFRVHANLARHEAYKILFMGKAAIILLLFAFLLGNGELGRRYAPSVREEYYRELMLTLEGEPNEEKTALIAAEQARYDEAFLQIERIDEQIASGEIDEDAGESRKFSWYGVTSFYPAFQRVLQQKDHVEEKGGVFIYDTGFLYLFGQMDNRLATDFLLLAVCIVFAFGNVMAMEYEKKSWDMLGTTARGKSAVVKKKLSVCALCSAVMAILPWVFRGIAVSREYPLHGWTKGMQNIPLFFGFGIGMSIWLFALLAVAVQILLVMAVSFGVFALSWWRKSYMQTIFLALLALVAGSAAVWTLG